MKWRTTTRPNGDPDQREQILGWDTILPRTATIVSVLVGLGGGVAAYVNIIATQSAIIARLDAAERSLPDRVARSVGESGFVLRSEWLEDKVNRDREALENIKDLKERMTRVEEHTYHTLRVVESYERPKGPEE